MSTTKELVKVEAKGQEVIMTWRSIQIVLSRGQAAILASKLQDTALGVRR